MSKKRVSLTLEQDLVEKVDRESERQDRNRSQTVEEIISDHFENQGLKTAVVLCGGEELRSLKLHSGESVLSHILKHLSEQGINRAILLTGNNRERLEKEFGSCFNGVDLEYFSEEQPKGTAAALKQVEPELNSSFLVVNGHVIAEVDLDEMFRIHNDQDTLATMALTTVENPSDFGVARLKGQKILGFEEKPSPGEEPSRLINAGTYILEPGIFSSIEGPDLEIVFEKLANDSELSGYIYGGEWSEVEG